MSKRRVVITGLGMLSPVGNSVSDSWQNILKGTSGVADITKFDTEGFETKFAATVNYDPENYLDKKEDVDQKYFIDGDILQCLEAWDEMIKEFDIGEKISPTIMINEHYNGHTSEDFENYAGWRKDYITKNKPLINKYKDKWDIWYEKHKDILQKREIYGKLEWQVGKIKPNDSIFN